MELARNYRDTFLKKGTSGLGWPSTSRAPSSPAASRVRSLSSPSTLARLIAPQRAALGSL
ncbi:MAG: hypothetical protein QXH42_01580 [Thermoplasmata archaeon]